MITETNIFTLESHDGQYEKWPRKTKLFVSGEYTGAKIQGYIIEAQFSVSDNYLIITSQDCLFEESNDFVLLNKKYKVIGKETLCEAYTSFLLEEFKIKSNTELKIKYNGERFIYLIINPELKVFFKKKMNYKTCDDFT